jgi:outer membrane protein OmpA-like peptidoglycan-associated protein
MMKKKRTYLLLFFMHFELMLYGQNLISNAGFEGGWACPEDFTREPVNELIPHWLNPNKGTPDYFHACSDSMAGVPDNFAGHMPAYEGDAYIGLILREVFIDSVSPRKVSREYITIELNHPLDFRKLYCFKLQYALAYRSSFAFDALGMSLTREKLKSWDAGLLDAEPLVFNTPGHIMKNKSEWHELCGVFRARGRESFLTIGNFCPNLKTHYYENTDSLADSSFVYAYYYIDDVKLYEIENPFECGCQDKLSQGYDWLDDDSQSFLEAYNNYIEQLNQDEMLAEAGNISGNNDATSINNGQSGQNKPEGHAGNNESDQENNSAGNSSGNNEASDSGNNSKQGNNGTSGNDDTSGSEKTEGNDHSNNNTGYSNNQNDNTNAGNQNQDNNATGDETTNDDGTSGQNGNNNKGNPDYNSISGQIREGDLDNDEAKLIESLKDATTGFSIELPKIYFAFNQSELLPSSYSALEKLSQLLKTHEGLEIEIRGHTDNIGSNWYNKRLSVDRAEAVYQFLIESGLDESRLKYRGFGNKVPIADNDTEEGRQLNRRVEIKVVSNR